MIGTIIIIINTPKSILKSKIPRPIAFMNELEKKNIQESTVNISVINHIEPLLIGAADTSICSFSL